MTHALDREMQGVEPEIKENSALNDACNVTVDSALPYRAVTMPDIDELRAAAELVQEREELGLAVGRLSPPSGCAVASRQGSLTTSNNLFEHSRKSTDPVAVSVVAAGDGQASSDSSCAANEGRTRWLDETGCPVVSTGAAQTAAPGSQRRRFASTDGECGATSNLSPGAEEQRAAALSSSGHHGQLPLGKETKDAEESAEYKDEDPIPWLRVNVARYASYFMLHFLYFCFLNLLGAVVIYHFERGRVRFVDTLFVTASASSMTGLSTIEFVTLSLGSQLMLMSLIILGSQVLMSAVPVLLRRHFYRKRAQRAIEALHRYNTISGPAEVASGTSMSSLSTGKANDHLSRPALSLSRSASQDSSNPPQSGRGAPEALPGAVSFFLRGRWPRKVAATASTDIAVPVSDQGAKAFLPYPYAFVSVDELLCNEVAEYQALNLLLKCIVLYFFCVQLIPLLIWGFYLSNARPVNVEGSFEAVQRPWYFAAFHAVSSFNNCGFTLLKGNLVSLVEDRCVLLLMSLLILLGNTFYPIAMRFIVWCVHCSNLAKEELEAADENSEDQYPRLHGAEGEHPAVNGVEQQQQQSRLKPVESDSLPQQAQGKHLGSLWGRDTNSRKKVYCDASVLEAQSSDVGAPPRDSHYQGKRSKVFDIRSRRFSRSLLSPPNQPPAEGFSQARSYWGFRFLKAMERRCKGFFRLWFLFGQACRGCICRCFCCCGRGMLPFQTAKGRRTQRWCLCIFERPRSPPENAGKGSAFPASSVTHFLLDDPRRCFTHMFRGSQTWWLLVVACTILLLEIVTYMALDFRKPHLRQFSTGTKFLIAWFQSVSIRTAGFNVIDIAQSSRAVQLLWVCFMYIASYPFIIAVRSTSTHVASPKTPAAASTSGALPVDSEETPDGLEHEENEKSAFPSSFFCEAREKTREDSTASRQCADFDAEAFSTQPCIPPQESELLLDARSSALRDGHNRRGSQPSFPIRRPKPFCRPLFDLPPVKECHSMEGSIVEEPERTYETENNKAEKQQSHAAPPTRETGFSKGAQTSLITALPYTELSEKGIRESSTANNGLKSNIPLSPQAACDVSPLKSTQLSPRTALIEERFSAAPASGEGINVDQPAPERPVSATDDVQLDSQHDAVLVHTEPSDGAQNSWTAALNSAWLQSHREAVIRQTQALLLKDVFWLFLVVFFICIFEDAQMSRGGAPLHIFSIVFETVSAYGTVGLSMGVPDKDFSLSGILGTGSKILLIILMLLGRHRGLPLAIDRSVNLPDLLNARSAVDRRNSQEAVGGVPSHSLLASQVRRCASQPCNLAPDAIVSAGNPWNNQLNLAVHYYRHPISREQLQAHRAWLSGKLLRVRSGTPESTMTLDDVAPPSSFLCSGPAIFREIQSQKHQLQRGLDSRGAEAYSGSSGGVRRTSGIYPTMSGVTLSSAPGTHLVNLRDNEDQKAMARGSAFPSRFYSHVTLPTAPSAPLLPYTVFWAPTVPAPTSTGSAGHRRFDPVCNLGVDQGRSLAGSHFSPASWNPGTRAPWSRPLGYNS